MSTPTVPQRISRTEFHATATPRAQSLTVDYYLDGDTMIVASATTPGKLYIVTATECSCEAGRRELLCKHATYRLDKLYPRKPMSAKQYVQACTGADEYC